MKQAQLLARRVRKMLPSGVIRSLQSRILLIVADDAGMSTVEYAIGTVAAAAFGAVLYTVVTGDSIVAALNRIVGRALSTKV